jgi:hypothetical protein
VRQSQVRRRPNEIKVIFDIPPDYPTLNYAPSWNVASTDQLPIVRYDPKAGASHPRPDAVRRPARPSSHRRGWPFYWGHRDRQRRLFNGRKPLRVIIQIVRVFRWVSRRLRLSWLPSHLRLPRSVLQMSFFCVMLVIVNAG